jgi:hypothetical protein
MSTIQKTKNNLPSIKDGYSKRGLLFWLEGIANQKSDLEVLKIKSRDGKLNL